MHVRARGDVPDIWDHEDPPAHLVVPARILHVHARQSPHTLSPEALLHSLR